jgi:hypothetical protein
MNHPVLFDVPKDAPSHEQRLKAFCEREKIYTHHTPRMTREEHPWQAMLLPGNYRGIKIPYQESFKSDEPVEIIAGYCRILEESGFLATGATKREAVERLCLNLRIPFAT